ncbi:MAG: cytidine deaminase [Chthonomonas sp.]|nr:cytidine deaminase [Chthonomonas sp.]
MIPTDLFDAAVVVRDNAYVPYSGYRVGCALRGSNGTIYTGCNVENVSYGAAICAERSAIMTMVSQGCTEIMELVVVTEDGGTPCGLCLQVIAEFISPAAVIWCAGSTGHFERYSFADLMPNAFRSDRVGRATDASAE